MKNTTEALSIILLCCAGLGAVIAIILDFSMIVFSAVALLVGMLFRVCSKIIENQERIIALLEANPNEDEKEKSRTE